MCVVVMAHAVCCKPVMVGLLGVKRLATTAGLVSAKQTHAGDGSHGDQVLDYVLWGFVEGSDLTKKRICQQVPRFCVAPECV